MRGPSAFVMTLSLFIPAVGGAGPEQREKLFAPGATGLVFDGSEVVASLDHRLVDSGAIVHVSVHASQRVRVGVVALLRTPMEGGRVPEPPGEVLYRELVIDGSADIPIKLAGASMRFGDYTIYVMKPGDARALHRLASAALPSTPSTDPDSDLGTVGEGTMALLDHMRSIENSSAIMLEAWSRPVDPAVALALPERATVDEPFPVTIALTNPTGKAMHGLRVEVSAPELDLHGDSAYLGLPASAMRVDPIEPIDLAPHEHKTITVNVSASQTGVLGLQARALCPYDHADCPSDEHLATGTFDAVDIAEPQVHILAGG
jgi:hypothetical protein